MERQPTPFALNIFEEAYSNFSTVKTDANCQMLLRPSTLWIYEVAKEISLLSPQSFVSPLLPFTSLCTAVTAPCLLPLSAALKTSHPGFIFSSNIWWQAVGSVLQEYRHNCIHCSAYYTEFSYSVYLRGGKAHPSGYDSLSISWTCELGFAAFPFAAALCYPREKDAERDQGPLCISMALNVI